MIWVLESCKTLRNNNTSPLKKKIGKVYSSEDSGIQKVFITSYHIVLALTWSYVIFTFEVIITLMLPQVIVSTHYCCTTLSEATRATIASNNYPRSFLHQSGPRFHCCSKMRTVGFYYCETMGFVDVHPFYCNC